MLHSLRKEASALLCEGVHGKFIHIVHIYHISHIFISITCVLMCILKYFAYYHDVFNCIALIPARFEDGYEDDDWHVIWSQHQAKCASKGWSLVPTRSRIRSYVDQRRFWRNLLKHLEPRKGTVISGPQTNWWWQSQPWLPCVTVGDSEPLGNHTAWAVQASLGNISFCQFCQIR
jgi:hypothetical protein